jgi:hypothetical protein
VKRASGLPVVGSQLGTSLTSAKGRVKPPMIQRSRKRPPKAKESYFVRPVVGETAL